MITDQEIDETLKSYIDCALWVGVLGPDEYLTDEEVSGHELSDDAREQMRQDVENFLTTAERLGITMTQTLDEIGHDFWLTRNGHGAGFWDRGLGRAGEELTTLAESFGSANLYIGDDGKIYHD